MKKIILTMAAVLALTFANAQKKGDSSDGMKFGVKGGLDLVSVKYNGGGSESLTGFFVGGFAEFSIADQFTLQPGLNYHTATKSVNGVDVKANFLSIPVLVKYQIAEKFNVLAGPSLYYSLESNDTDKTRFNLDLGASYDITDNFFVEPRYSVGLSGDAKVSHFLIGVGYKF
ncbi:porin family protein [Flavobacterium sp. N1994]|uniref:porin family protein n=1 Tax=Flavobacterium sp. N1994 TaxID=2986827 RepID=UPI002223B45D|nr:porin family protein [Flavobacterium sp. N1994]